MMTVVGLPEKEPWQRPKVWRPATTHTAVVGSTTPAKRLQRLYENFIKSLAKRKSTILGRFGKYCFSF